MELPDDVLHIIKDYAQPITRPDWRTMHKMTNEQYYKNLLPHIIIRYRTEEGVVNVVCLKDIQLKIFVTKTDMGLVMNKID